MRLKDGLVINWVVPPPFDGSGGHANIFRAMKQLSEFGHTVNLFSWPSKDVSSEGELASFIRERFFDIRANGYSMDLSRVEYAEGDVLVATLFTTVYHVAKNVKIPLKIYFIQDFEPLFFPMGDEYLLAENTYQMGLRGISSGPWCARLVRERYGMECEYFMFPVDRTVYYPRSVARRNRLLFFARPEYPRRCYSLGLRALALFHRRLPDVEIVLYGARGIDSLKVPFPHLLMGLLPTVDGLAELYSSARAGLVFSTTNPSLVPFEMMACRCAVVDLNYNNSAINYGSEKNLILTGTMPEEIAEGLVRVWEDKNLWWSTVENAYHFVERFPSEVEMARRIESLIHYYRSRYDREKRGMKDHR